MLKSMLGSGYFHLKSLLYYLLVALSVVLVLRVWPHTQSYWLLWSAFFLASLRMSLFWGRQIFYLGITGLCASILVFIVGLIAHPLWLLAICFFLFVFISILAEQIWQQAFMPIFITGFLSILAVGLPPASTSENGLRLVAMLGGTAIVVFWQWIYRPHYFRDRFLAESSILLQALAALNAEVFSCLLQQTYAENVYLFERRLHMHKYNVMRMLREINALLHYYGARLAKNQQDALNQLYADMRHLYEVILDLAQLRWRVQDSNTLTLCTNELTALQQKSAELFHMRLQEYDATAFRRAVDALQDNYVHVLQVSAKEPMPFFLFLQTLPLLSDLLERILASITLLKGENAW